MNIRWLDAEAFDPRSLADIDGILVPGGFGKRGIEGKIQAIRYARENKKPYLGLCLGFQLAVIEYARHILGIEDATSEEIGEGTHVIALLPEQEGISELGGTMRLGDCSVTLKEGTMVAGLYGETSIVERHRHRYEVNPAFIADIEAAGLVFRFLRAADGGLRNRVTHSPRDTVSPRVQVESVPFPPYVGFVEACKKNKSTQSQVAEQNDER